MYNVRHWTFIQFTIPVIRDKIVCTFRQSFARKMTSILFFFFFFFLLRTSCRPSSAPDWAAGMCTGLIRQWSFAFGSVTCCQPSLASGSVAGVYSESQLTVVLDYQFCDLLPSETQYSAGSQVRILVRLWQLRHRLVFGFGGFVRLLAVRVQRPAGSQACILWSIWRWRDLAVVSFGSVVSSFQNLLLWGELPFFFSDICHLCSSYS